MFDPILQVEKYYQSQVLLVGEIHPEHLVVKNSEHPNMFYKNHRYKRPAFSTVNCSSKQD